MHNKKVQLLFSSLKIQQAFLSSYAGFSASGPPLPDVQRRAAHAIMRCKSGKLGCNASFCQNCGHLEVHNNSCRNRNCPNCQAAQKGPWVGRRRAEAMDAPCFHVVFTLPHELDPPIFANRKAPYGLSHRCCAGTLLELCADKRYLGAQPGIIQVPHAWNQEMLYHVHMHCILSGGGPTKDGRIRKSRGAFFLPAFVLRDKFKGKYLALLDRLYMDGALALPDPCSAFRELSGWQAFRGSLYRRDWCPYIKGTFNGFGNAVEYLGRYTHKIAISNSRILSVTGTEVTFSARGLKPGGPKRTITMGSCGFIRRFLLHVLPRGFQKIRYYGFLNSRPRPRNLKLIFTLQGHQRFQARFTGMSMAQLILAVWKKDITRCPICGAPGMRPAGRAYASG